VHLGLLLTFSDANRPSDGHCRKSARELAGCFLLPVAQLVGDVLFDCETEIRLASPYCVCDYKYILFTI
jgi:hypothetical protein